MYGTTPVPFDPSLGIKYDAGNKSFRCIGFTNRNNIRDQHFTGTGVWLVVPQKLAPVSEKLFVALVNVMKSSELAMIARYVYRNGTKAKIMALVTQPDTEKNQYKKNASLLMMELHFAGEFMNFSPKTFSQKIFFFIFISRGSRENAISFSEKIEGQAESGAI